MSMLLLCAALLPGDDFPAKVKSRAAKHRAVSKKA